MHLLGCIVNLALDGAGRRSGVQFLRRRQYTERPFRLAGLWQGSARQVMDNEKAANWAASLRCYGEIDGS